MLENILILVNESSISNILIRKLHSMLSDASKVWLIIFFLNIHKWSQFYCHSMCEIITNFLGCFCVTIVWEKVHTSEPIMGMESKHFQILINKFVLVVSNLFSKLLVLFELYKKPLGVVCILKKKKKKSWKLNNAARMIFTY